MSAIPEERDPERRIETLSRRMKADWDGRALKNARYYIATSCDDSESAFRASGLSDVEHFFTGLEHLLSPEKVLLDIGCGIGRMDEHIAPRVGRIIGLDVSAEMVRRARERLAHVGNIEFLEGNGRDLGVVPDGSVDLAFSHIVFQHMAKAVVAGYLSDARRVLVPGGGSSRSRSRSPSRGCPRNRTTTTPSSCGSTRRKTSPCTSSVWDTQR